MLWRSFHRAQDKGLEWTQVAQQLSKGLFKTKCFPDPLALDGMATTDFTLDTKSDTMIKRTGVSLCTPLAGFKVWTRRNEEIIIPWLRRSMQEHTMSLPPRVCGHSWITILSQHNEVKLVKVTGHSLVDFWSKEHGYWF